MSTPGSLVSFANASPAIRTVSERPPAARVTVEPTEVPVSVRKVVLTSTEPEPEYHDPLMIGYPVQLASPSNAGTSALWDSPATPTVASVSGTQCAMSGLALSAAAIACCSAGDALGDPPVPITFLPCPGWTATGPLGAGFSRSGAVSASRRST